MGEQITDKITSMKARIEAYANKKEAVSYLNEHVHMKLQTVKEEMDSSETKDKESEEKVSSSVTNNHERFEALKELVKENKERFQKREQVKAMLEKQVLLGEKRAAEQIRITEAREKLLALKMRELELQKAKLARKKRATEDFLAHIDKQLEDMETKAATPQPTGAIP